MRVNGEERLARKTLVRDVLSEDGGPIRVCPRSVKITKHINVAKRASSTPLPRGDQWRGCPTRAFPC